MPIAPDSILAQYTVCCCCGEHVLWSYALDCLNHPGGNVCLSCEAVRFGEEPPDLGD